MIKYTEKNKRHEQSDKEMEEEYCETYIWWKVWHINLNSMEYETLRIIGIYKN